MHQAGGNNIFSFSDDQFVERSAQQNRRSEKLIIEEEEEEEASGRIYNNNNNNNSMLSEMFNYAAGPGDVVLAAAHESNSNIRPAAAAASGYHRLIEQTSRPDFYGGNINNINSRQQGSGLVMMMSTSTTAGSSASSPDHHHHHQMLHQQHHHHDQSRQQAFLGGDGMFGEGIISFGGGMMRCRESQQSGGATELSLTSSSSLQQLEMRKEEAFLFYNSQQQQEHQLLLHPTSIHQPVQPPPPPSSCLQSQSAAHQQSQGQYNYNQQLHNSSSTYGIPMSTANVLRNSKYARAAQELLEEFCSVSKGHVIRGINTTNAIRNSSNINPNLIIRHGSGEGVASTSAAAAPSSSSSKDIPPLSPADRFENQRKKSKLLSMLDEVERRYNHYCEQMQMVVNSFDSVMGFGAAMPYTALARKAMSKHFRCLKDAITSQLRQTCEVLGDNINIDGGIISGSGLTKGETPKLRLIDQNLRQQRAFHQMGIMEQEAWRPQRGLPDRSVTILRSWLFDHFLHPYPSDADKHLLARKTGLSRNQVSNWFINARVRLWKPMVEDMYQQESKEELEDSQLNQDRHETNTHRILLAAARTTQQQQQQQSDHHSTTSPESDALAETATVSINPYRPQLLQITDHEPTAADHHHTAAASNFPSPPVPLLEDEIYRRAAASRTGDLSLTLGLRHAGGSSNATDTTTTATTTPRFRL